MTGAAHRASKGNPIALARCAIGCLALALALGGQPSWARKGEKTPSLDEQAIDAVTQPLSDLGLRSKEIPPILAIAQAQPYALDGMENCDSLAREIERLDSVLGPDADSEADDSGTILHKGLKAGGNLLGGMIPFRGLVREISGAKRNEERWRSAIFAGVARRSFLKGYGRARQCLFGKEAAAQSARDVLDLPEGF